jgi:hypothetical protein
MIDCDDCDICRIVKDWGLDNESEELQQKICGAILEAFMAGALEGQKPEIFQEATEFFKE